MKFTATLFSGIFFSSMLSLAQPKLKLDTFSRTFAAPIDMAHDGFTSRVFIAQQNGIIWALDSDGVRLDTFIDLRTKVQSGGEEGLLGFAFHPGYKDNGYFYTYYTKKNTTDNAVFRYKVSANPNRAEKDTEQLVITLLHPGFTNHNGGCIKFGKDGYLYIAVGDGGGSGDPNGNGQNKNTLPGKILRLDVNNFSQPYSIPSTNPFFAETNVQKEIWAYGLRNPWRFSFDKNTGDLWIADVGQNNREEVNFQSSASPGGENYGWRCYEGNAVYSSTGCGSAGNYKFPVFDYPHNSSTGGFSITGGFIYKGSKYPDLLGYYIFSDYISGNFWMTKKTDTVFTTTQLSTPKQSNVSSFGEDLRGELYACNLNNGVVYKIRELCSPFQLILVSKKNPSCADVTDGRIEVNSTGSNGNVTYNWSNGSNGSIITNLSADKYIVTATDAIGCIRKDSFSLIRPDTIKIHLNSKTNPSCPDVANGSIQVNGSGGNGIYSYSWSNGITTATNNNLSNGIYTLILTDSNHCAATDSFELVNADTLAQPIIHLSNDTLYTADGFTFKWFRNDTLIADATQSNYKPVRSGLYKVEITDINGCKALSDTLTYIITSVIDRNDVPVIFSIYPNPVSETLTLDLHLNSTKPFTLIIINSIGQLVYSEHLQEKDFVKIISMQQFPKGVYQLFMNSEDGQSDCRTFVKE